MRRLSTGLRVNKAADDAAGLAVAEGLDARARSTRVALRNLGDALSAADIADGGLDEVTSTLHRLRELAVQAASETLDDGARAHLQVELTEMLGSVTDTAMNTTFNGTPLLANKVVDVGLIVDLSGSMGGELFQVKTSIGTFKNTITSAGLNVALGLGYMGGDTLDGVTRAANVGDAGFDDALQDLSIIGAVPMEPYSALLNASGAADETGQDDPDGFGWHQVAERKVMVLVTDAGRETSYTSLNQQEVADAIAALGVEVHVIGRPAVAGTFSTLTGTTGGTFWDIGSSSGSGVPAALANIAADLSAIPPSDPLQIQAGPDAGDRFDLGVAVNVTAQGLSIDGVSVETSADALTTLDALDGALDTVNQARALVGAKTNRLEVAVRSQETQLAEAEAARGRIQDADMAHETALMARDQILAQVSVAVMAQARSIERDAVLALL
jgi:flagellin